jgi:hypothetical protein
MPSLFSRTRTTSSPLKSHKPQSETADDFGRVPSRGPPRVTATTGPAKKDKNAEKPRTRTLSAAKGRAPGLPSNEDEPIIPDGSFFPLNLDPPGDAGGAPDSERGPSCPSIKSSLSALVIGGCGGSHFAAAALFLYSLEIAQWSMLCVCPKSRVARGH